MKYEMIRCDASWLDKLVEFYDAVIDHLDATVNYPIWEKGVYPARDSIAAAIDRAEQWACLDDGCVIGALRITEGNYPPASWSLDLRGDEYCIIHSFATHPDCVGRGVGSEMLRWCVAHARKAGLRAIRIDVVPDNLPAVRLYEKHGFRFVEQQDLGVEGIPLFSLFELDL